MIGVQKRRKIELCLYNTSCDAVRVGFSAHHAVRLNEAQGLDL